MRAILQRVGSASVRIDGDTIAAIGPGVLVLVGITHGDGRGNVERLAHKISTLRMFDDDQGRMSESLGGREILCVSQFTLYGDVDKGTRPSFSAAADRDRAEPLYEFLCDLLDAQRGRFGARMAVELVNEGPVTLLVEA